MSDDRSRRFQQGAARIAAFASLSYAVDYSFQLVDIFWVARLGAGAPTAIAIASSALFLVLALNEVVGAGTVPLFTQTAGTGNRERTGLVILQALFVKLVLGAVMALIFGAFMLWMAPRYDIDAATRSHLGAYGKVIWLLLLFVPVYSTMMTALRSLGGEAEAALASAEYAMRAGRPGDAVLMAERARRIFKEGAPGRLRAEDLLGMLKRQERGR